jgi:hypothetical protein
MKAMGMVDDDDARSKLLAGFETGRGYLSECRQPQAKASTGLSLLLHAPLLHTRALSLAGPPVVDSIPSADIALMLPMKADLYNS